MAVSTKALALFLTLALLSSTLASACGTCGCPVPKTPTTPKPPTPAKPHPYPPPKPKKCPLDTLKLGVCADILGLVNVIIGKPPTAPCCSLIGGLTDLEAAVCLCTALKANVLGINLNVPISLSILLNTCSKTPPTGYQCP